MARANFKVAGIVAATLGVAILAAYPVMGQKAAEKKVESKEEPTSFWMKKKLECSQNILAGIATANYDQIVENAQAMRNLSTIEAFVRRQTPGYRTQLHIFQESTDEIIRQAKRENVEGAALAFTQLTISCVNCHKHLRETK